MSENTETYIVNVETHPTEGHPLKKEWKNANGFLHNPHGPAVEEFNHDTGELEATEYWVAGTMTRVGGPSFRHWYPRTNIVIEEKWMRDGQLHREDGLPAYICNDPAGVPAQLYFAENGRYHREDGPAKISWTRPERLAVDQHWFLHGVLHRDNNLPAVVIMDEITFVVTEEDYYVEGRLHRTNGPALIRRNEDTGVIEAEEYWENGERINVSVLPGPET